MCMGGAMCAHVDVMHFRVSLQLYATLAFIRHRTRLFLGITAAFSPRSITRELLVPQMAARAHLDRSIRLVAPAPIDRGLLAFTLLEQAARNLASDIGVFGIVHGADAVRYQMSIGADVSKARGLRPTGSIRSAGFELNL
jgi:hypothetical protein